MGVRAGLALSIALAACAGEAGADEATHARFRATMDQVFGAAAWRITGGYRTEARENELRAQGALTVRPGAVSRHSVGDPAAPGAYDVVVAGLSPFEAADRLRRAGAPFRTIFPEAAHGSQGPHLHLDPYDRAAGGLFSPPGLRWTVADPSPADQALAALRAEATRGQGEAQLRLGEIYAQGRREDRVEAYVWTALAAANAAAEPATRLVAQGALDALAATMSPQDVADARRFAPAPGEMRASTYGPIIARPSAAQAVRVAETGVLRITFAAACLARCLGLGEGAQDVGGPLPATTRSGAPTRYSVPELPPTAGGALQP